MADIFKVERGEVRTEAQRQRERVEQEAAEATARVEQEEEEARQRAAQQEREAQAKVEAQAKEAKEKAAAEAKAEQARTRKAQSRIEREAEAAKAKAREAARLEARKKDLPITKPRPLDVVGYISQVEVARKKAHSEGRDARAEVVRLTDKYHKEVDKAAQEALSSIKQQKKGIDLEIAKAGIEAQTEIAKQVLSLGSGIKEWESEGLANIQKAEDKYEADIQAALNRPGTVVFAEMLEQRLIPKNAVYESYNKTTGEVSYTLKDTRPGSVIFADLQGQGKIPKEATYTGYNSDTGKVSYALPDTRTGQEIFADMQAKGDIPKEAIYKSYNSTTGKVSYNLPDTRSGQEIFADMRAKGEIPKEAIYKGFNKKTRVVIYNIPDPRTGEQLFKDLQKEGTIPANAVYKSYNATTREVKYTVAGEVKQAEVTGEVTGEEVFAAMQARGEISKDAVFKGYDKETGQVTFNIPVTTLTAEGIFKDMQKQGLIPSDAVYQSFNRITGKIRYEIPAADGGKETVTTSPGVAAAAGAATLVLPGLKGTAWAMTAFPEPSSTIIGLLILGTLGLLAYINRDKLQDMFAKEAAVSQASASVVDIAVTSPDMVVTDRSGIAPVTVQQIERGLIASNVPYTLGTTAGDIPTAQALTLERGDMAIAQAFTLERGDTPTLVTPLEQPMLTKEGYPIEEAKPVNLTFPLIQELWQPEGFPKVKEKPVVMTRFPLDADPILQGKARNIMIAAQAVATASRNWQRVAVKEKVITREDYEVLQRLVEVGRKVITGEEYRRLEQIKAKITRAATSPNVSESHRIAYQEYLRKKIILDAARKAYVASLNPQPVKGVGSNKATAAAIGIWLTIDIMRAALVKALSTGQSVEQALKSVQVEIEQVAQVMGVTQKQLTVAIDTVVYETALQTMTQAAINAAVQGQTEAQIKTATQAATKIAVQVATATHALTATQVAALTKVLSIAAVNIIAMVQILPPPLLKLAKSDAAKKRKYPIGSIAWKQGIVWRGIPPPYKQAVPITTRKPPKGAVRTGLTTPQETLQIVGKSKAKVPESVSVDLGVSDILIKDGKKIAFTGQGLETVVGKSLPEPSRGMSIPAVVVNERWRSTNQNKKRRFVNRRRTDKRKRRLQQSASTF